MPHPRRNEGGASIINPRMCTTHRRTLAPKKTLRGKDTATGMQAVPLPREPPTSVFVTARTRKQFPHPLHCLIP